MKKYILKFVDYEECRIIGVFSTAQNAIDYCEKYADTALLDEHSFMRHAVIHEYKVNHPEYRPAGYYSKDRIEKAVDPCHNCDAFYDPHADNECSECQYNSGGNIKNAVWSSWEKTE
jgi:hypothetical protein